jgi:hypothetical protein
MGQQRDALARRRLPETTTQRRTPVGWANGLGLERIPKLILPDRPNPIELDRSAWAAE